MIELENVSKVFWSHRKSPGFKASLKSLFWRDWQKKTALDSVTLSIKQGELVGLLGANGAGKTSLVKVCTGIVHATSGKVRVLGHDPWKRESKFRTQISLIMGQKAQLWWDLPAADCFLLLREIYRVPKDEFAKRLDHLCDVLDVRSQLNTQIRRLSLGERMKMEIIASLLHRPKVIFLDEPTIGLDITSQRALRKFIQDYHVEHQPTIVLTSHYMEDIEALCKRVVIMRQGGIVFDGDIDVLKQRSADKDTDFASLIAQMQTEAQ